MPAIGGGIWLVLVVLWFGWGLRRWHGGWLHLARMQLDHVRGRPSAWKDVWTPAKIWFYVLPVFALAGAGFIVGGIVAEVT
jgi:hypothetical protein